MTCKKCLLKDIDKDEYFKDIYEYINSIDDDIKTPNEIYNSRLECCMMCSNLINGMCKVCGCFVEVRAIKIHNYCPMDREKWNN